MMGLGWMLMLGVLAWVLYRLFIAPQVAERHEVEHEVVEYESVERARMPAEIAGGRLMASEEYFRTRHPKPLGAQVDQVYLTRAGMLVPVETKRRYRKHVTAYDQIELSVQACVLRTARPSTWLRHEVADYGYVRVVAEGREPAYLRVDLLGDDELVRLYDRYWKIQRGEVKPAPASHGAICRKCAYLSRCPNPVSDIADIRRFQRA
jgi:CRISPR/Cas system-associated exonuclease Cas4 (RecB family)